MVSPTCTSGCVCSCHFERGWGWLTGQQPLVSLGPCPVGVLGPQTLLAPPSFLRLACLPLPAPTASDF